jgi:hypothetical protein
MTKNVETFPSDNPVNVLALLGALSPEKLAEAVAVETFDWTTAMYRKAMSQIGAKQKAFCRYVTIHGNDSLEDLQKGLKLQSAEEVEQVIADLRNQLIAMEINPQEVYAADLIVRNGNLEAYYYATGTFHDVWQKVNCPKEWNERHGPEARARSKAILAAYEKGKQSKAGKSKGAA